MSKKKKPECKFCSENIMFVYDYSNKKWIVVDSFDLDAQELYLRRERQPIPYQPNRHERHHCKEMAEHFGKFYQGGN